MLKKTSKSEIENYFSDEANYKGNCEEVFFPQNEEEVKSIFLIANHDKTKVTISGARTGLTGGCVPQNGILISTVRFNKIIEIDPNEKYAVVEPGVLLSELQTALKSKSLFYAPNPTETNCTVGGTLATNASGGRTFKYGPTRNFIEEINVVLPTGHIFNLKRGERFVERFKTLISLSAAENIELNIPKFEMPNTKHAAGFFCRSNMDLIDLFIGSEGTMGFITKMKLKLNPLPPKILSMLIYFKDENSAFSFVDEVRRNSKNQNHIMDFRELEFIDNNSLDLIRDDFPSIPNTAKSAIFIEQEYTNEIEDKLFTNILESIEKNNGNSENIWFAQNENEIEKIKSFRHAIPIKINEIIAQNKVTKVGTDTAVPHSNFNEFYFYTKDLISSYNIQYVVFGHIGDSHVHFNMLPKDKTELKTCKELYSKICKKSVELNGTISAEHGIGKLKTPYLIEMFNNEEITQMAKLKKTFDPNLILNIGNIIEEKYFELI